MATVAGTARILALRRLQVLGSKEFAVPGSLAPARRERTLRDCRNVEGVFVRRSRHASGSSGMHRPRNPRRKGDRSPGHSPRPRPMITLRDKICKIDHNSIESTAPVACPTAYGNFRPTRRGRKLPGTVTSSISKHTTQRSTRTQTVPALVFKTHQSPSGVRPVGASPSEAEQAASKVGVPRKPSRRTPPSSGRRTRLACGVRRAGA